MVETTTECTGIAASWCPIHGDCTCPDREQEKNSDDCPLHGRYSDHPRQVTLLERLKRIAAELRQLQADAEHWNRLHPDEEPIVIDVNLSGDVAARLLGRTDGDE